MAFFSLFTPSCSEERSLRTAARRFPGWSTLILCMSTNKSPSIRCTSFATVPTYYVRFCMSIAREYSPLSLVAGFQMSMNPKAVFSTVCSQRSPFHILENHSTEGTNLVCWMLLKSRIDRRLMPSPKGWKYHAKSFESVTYWSLIFLKRTRRPT